MVKAEANLGEKLVVEEPIEFVDNEGNVMAIFIPYSEDNPAPTGFEKATSH